VLVFRFIRSLLSMNSHVVHIYSQPPFCDVVGEYGIHHCLESGWGIGESEEHDSWFE
jgi:hypothetical protein